MNRGENRIYWAPSGKIKVRVHEDCFVEPIGEIDRKTGALIEEVSLHAFELSKGDPFKAFELMGWKEDVL